MSRPIIIVENLGKKYRIKHQAEQQKYVALRDVISDKVKGLFKRSRPATGDQKSVEDFWALKDVSFEVKEGEVVGIIGRNGAGKSTLLKILSQITEPTEGRICLRGRVSSLLEVGTGFHPELTGRENIFLNGAILGMSQGEIKKKFDEIVAFAEVEKFLDTPVKRYSSGMYLRLAFAVAAHLEPEILIVDEVLAVGDAQFQQKCLGKMQEVSQGGRTVLFVSHNMGAVRTLCNRALEIRAGKIVQAGPVEGIVMSYLRSGSSQANEVSWLPEQAPGTERFKLRSLQVRGRGKPVTEPLLSGDDLEIKMDFWTDLKDRDLCIGFELLASNGSTLLWSYHSDGLPTEWPMIVPGRNNLICQLPRGMLNRGMYCIAPKVSCHNRYWIINSLPVLQFEVHLNHGQSPFWTDLGDGSRPGMIAPVLNWTADKTRVTETRELNNYA